MVNTSNLKKIENVHEDFQYCSTRTDLSILLEHLRKISGPILWILLNHFINNQKKRKHTGRDINKENKRTVLTTVVLLIYFICYSTKLKGEFHNYSGSSKVSNPHFHLQYFFSGMINPVKKMN